MKNLAIVTLISIGAISLNATPALAAGEIMYREVKSNNLFECSTNRQIEHIWTGGNSTSYGSTHTLICFDGDRKAKWVMTSEIRCKSGPVPIKCPKYFNEAQLPSEYRGRGFTKLEDADNTYLYNPKKTGIGTNCKIVSETSKYGSVFYNWNCEKYSAYENLTINTKGVEPLQWRMTLFRKYGRIPSQFQFETPEDPNCNKFEPICAQNYSGLGGDSSKLDPRIYIDCRGDDRFCDWYYNPKPV